MILNYTVLLRGLDPTTAGLPGPLLGSLLNAVDRGTRGAVRLRLEGRSAAAGKAPGWVSAAATFRMVDFTDEVPGVQLHAAPLAQTVPERIAQYSLFGGVDGGQSAFALMIESLDEAVRGNRDSDAYDESLLSTFEAFGSVFRHGVESVEIRNGRQESPVVRITPAGMEVVKRLQRETPRPHRVRVAGTVDAIRHSDRAFTLVLQGGGTVRGVLTEGDAESLTPYFGQVAVVSGEARYRPSGSLLRVDASSLSPGSEADLSLWSEKPRPRDTGFAPRELIRPQGPRSGLNALIGAWPGEESDEEIFAMLDELS